MAIAILTIAIAMIITTTHRHHPSLESFGTA